MKPVATLFLLVLVCSTTSALSAPVNVSMENLERSEVDCLPEYPDEGAPVLQHIRKLGFDNALPAEYEALQLRSHFEQALREVSVDVISLEDATKQSLPILCVLAHDQKLFSVVVDVNPSGKRIPIWYASVDQPRFAVDETQRLGITQAAAATIARKLVDEFRKSHSAGVTDNRQSPCNNVDRK